MRGVRKRGIRRWEEVRGGECRWKEEVSGFHPPTPQLFKIIVRVKGPSTISSSIPKEESRRKRQEEARGCMGKYEEVLEEGRGPRVPRSQGPKDQDISNSHSNMSLTLKKVHLV